MFLAGILHAGDGNLLKNGRFDAGLLHWKRSEPPLGEITVENGALRIDARGIAWGEAALLSDPVPVRPRRAYRVSADVKRLFGNGYRCTVGILWRAADGSLLGADGLCDEVLWGGDWRAASTTAVAPEGAATAIVKLALEMGAGEKNAALFANARLEPAKAPAPETAVAGPSGSATLPTLAPTATKDLTAPTPPRMKVRLGAYYFPVTLDWGEEGGPSGLRNVPGDKPLLGYYDERLPATADWHIVWALTHGITWFAVDWYWNQSEEYINEALDDGLMKSRFFPKIDFCLLWANQEPTATSLRAYDYSPETMRELARTLCERYFNRPNYLKVDGRPVFLIFLPASLVNANGSAAAARAALASFRAEVRAHGHPDAFLVAINNSPVLPPVAEAGFDAVSAYNYSFAGTLPERRERLAFPFRQILPRYKKWALLNETQAHAQGLPFIPAAWGGWDDLPRFGAKRADQSSFTPGNTPAATRALAEMLVERADPRLRLALVEAWNEWGEGSVYEPGERYGFGHLAGLRDILATDGHGPYTVPIPDAASKLALQAKSYAPDAAPYAERANRARQWKDGFAISFASRRELALQPGAGAAYFQQAEGRLKVAVAGSSAELRGPWPLFLDASRVRAIRVKAHLPRDGRATLSWITTQDRAWNAEKSLAVPTRAGNFPIEFPVSKSPAWKGEIYQFRLAFAGVAGGFELDEVASVPARR